MNDAIKALFIKIQASFRHSQMCFSRKKFFIVVLMLYNVLLPLAIFMCTPILPASK